MKVLICLVALFAVACHAVPAGSKSLRPSPLLDTEQRIVGGSQVDITRHPHQISMRYKHISVPENAFNHRCGGSVYKDNVIITAAHCIIALVPSQLQVVAGTSKRNAADGVIVRVKEIVMHADYDPETTDNDIALLILETPLPLNNITIKAIDMLDTVPAHGTMSRVTGWGTTTEGGLAANYLQEVSVPIVSNDICNEDYDEEDITDAMMCAGFRGIGGADACQGDSGGPLIVNNKLAGVVSWGYGCARAQYPGVYASVPYFYDWVLEKVAQHA